MEELSQAEIESLLKGQQKERKTKSVSTSIREINVWLKLPHHICLSYCEHREQSPTGNACWNPDCFDHTRDKRSNRGTNVVALVKGQYLCRYCYLAGWLS